MLIKNIDVSNYRSLKTVNVRALKPINMLYGYNNTGKSNLLRFLDLVFRRKTRFQSVKYTEGDSTKETRIEEPVGWWEGEFKDMPFMFTDDKTDLNITFAVVMGVPHTQLGEVKERIYADFLRQDHGTAHIRLEGMIRSVTYEDSEISLRKVVINNKIAFDAAKTSTDRYFPGKKELLGQVDTLNSLLARFNDCVLCLRSDRYMTEELEQRALGKLAAQNTKNWLFDYYMDSKKHAKFAEFLAFLKNYQSQHASGARAANAWRQWPFSTADIGFSRFGQNIDVMLRNSKSRFPLSSYGTGVQQILYLLARLFFTPARIVLIEEIELNLSPTAQRELLKNLIRLRSDSHLDQVLFTTHSEYFQARTDFEVYEATLNDAGYTTISRRTSGKPRRDFFRGVSTT